MMPSIPQILMLLVLIVAIVVPPVLILMSSRTQGGAKFGWFVGALFFSWIAYAAFLVYTRRQQDFRGK